MIINEGTALVTNNTSIILIFVKPIDGKVIIFSRADVKWIDPAEVLEGGKRLPALLSRAEHKF